MKLFSPEENQYISTHYQIETYKEIGQHLGRSKDSIHYKIQALKLQKKHPIAKTEMIIKLARETSFPQKTISKMTGTSLYKIRTILKSNNLQSRNTICKKGWNNGGKLIDGFSFAGNKTMRDRAKLLYAYNRICFDCKKTFLDNELVTHHDWNELPIKIYLLCKSCNKKRHNVNDYTQPR